MKERIISLEATVKDLINNEMIRQREDEMMEDENKTGESSFTTNESSYYIREDIEFKEIMKEELRVTSNLKTDISDIIENIKPRKIDETLGKLKILKLNIHNDVRDMKKVERHSETEKYSEEFYQMIDKFMKMPETLSKIAKNKFKKVAEDELKELLNKDIKWVQQDKQGNLIGMFDI